MENELKPCPHCGGQAKLHKKGNRFYVECDGDCWTQTDKHSYPENAVKEWNGLERRKEEKTLFPCPFCGGEALLEEFSARKGFESSVSCCNCPASMASITYDTQEEATEAITEYWNRRCTDGT